MTSTDATHQTPGPEIAADSAESFILHWVQKRRLMLCLALAVVTIALYSPVTRAPFLNYDDQICVSENAQVRAGLNWNTVAWAFHTPKDLDWHPLTWLSYGLDTQVFGLGPSGYHTTNLLLHAANVVLLFLILQSATGFVWRSLAVAALFALHPINVESVAWISERKNVLSMFFFLIALAAYGWYARRPGVGRYLTVTLAFVLALMSKAQVITFPFALLLLDYWPLRRIQSSPGSAEAVGDAATHPSPTFSFLKLVAEKLPWFALSTASAVITMRTGTAFSYIAETGANESRFPLWIRLANAAMGYVKYLEKTFWPADLAPLYPHPGFATSISAALVSALVLITITILVVIWRQHRVLFVGWFWFLGILLPMSGVITIGPHFMADRYLYIPQLGIFLIVCWGVADLMERWPVPVAAYATTAALIALVLGVALYRQVSFWSDNATLWEHTVAVTDGNFTAEENLAMALISTGRAKEALPHLQRAHVLQPADPLATLNLATYEQMLGNYKAAIEGYAAVVQFPGTSPSLLATALANSGYAHLSLHRYDSAQQEFEAALHEQPVNAAAYRGLGLLAQRAGNVTLAAKDYKRSVELQPTPVGYLLLAYALELGGERDASRAAQIQAARIDPDLNDDLATVRQLLAN
jgi:Tfp pilus assembly protein PilF